MEVSGIGKKQYIKLYKFCINVLILKETLSNLFFFESYLYFIPLISKFNISGIEHKFRLQIAFPIILFFNHLENKYWYFDGISMLKVHTTARQAITICHIS